MSMFKKCVLEVVSCIPRGQVMSYREVAVRAGFPRAYRAVGSLMMQNRDSSVPCHRVIKSDGSVGGYNNGGVVEKQKRLSEEGVVIEGGRVCI